MITFFKNRRYQTYTLSQSAIAWHTTDKCRQTRKPAKHMQLSNKNTKNTAINNSYLQFALFLNKR